MLALAQDSGVPILRVSADTISARDTISSLLPTVRFRHRAKVPAVRALLEKHFDHPALLRGLGLRQEATP